MDQLPPGSFWQDVQQQIENGPLAYDLAKQVGYEDWRGDLLAKVRRLALRMRFPADDPKERAESRQLAIDVTALVVYAARIRGLADGLPF